jgi:hypothetical protein
LDKLTEKENLQPSAKFLMRCGFSITNLSERYPNSTRSGFGDKGTLPHSAPRRLQGEGGRPLVVEFGLAEGGEVDTVYFHFDQKRPTIPIVPIGGVDQLFAAFESFGNAAADIIRASEPPLT